MSIAAAHSVAARPAQKAHTPWNAGKTRITQTAVSPIAAAPACRCGARENQPIESVRRTELNTGPGE